MTSDDCQVLNCVCVYHPKKYPALGTTITGLLRNVFVPSRIAGVQ